MKTLIRSPHALRSHGVLLHSPFRRTTLALGLLVAGSGAATAQTAPVEQTAAAVDVEADLTLEGMPEARTLELPLSGITLTERKSLDPVTGEITGLAFDQSGRAVDVSALLKRERELRLLQPDAKLDPALREAIADQPEAAHEVVIWLVYDDVALDQTAARIDGLLPADASDEELAAAEETMAAFAMEQIGGSNAAARDALEAMGVAIRYVSTSAPAIFVDATAAEVMQIAASPLVDTLYLESKDEADHNSSANGTHRATTTYSLGWRGAGIRVAVLENNGIDPNCPHLNVTQWFNPGSPNPDDHVHGTSGCIASQLSSRRGGAPSVSLYSANASSYSDTNITQAADWIAGRNIDATNMSYGGSSSGALRYKDRYFDYQSRVYQDSYVASAGNGGSWVGSPGLAWNCVTVGSFRDNDTSSWSGDAISTFSDFRNPATGCEKPNLAAVGELVDTIGMGPDWLRNNYSGTSFSAPFTTAALAVTMSRDSSARVSPEAAMAAMMASAWHNIEGSTRLSDRDGAGGLHQRAAARCGNSNRIAYIGTSPSSFSTNGYRTYNVSLTGGDRARVAIAWSANANSSYTSTVLNADLDLAVFAGANTTSGSSFGYSSSWNNNFEIIEFTPPTTGTYTIRINDYRFDGSYERVGLAWSQRYRDQGY